MKTRETTRSGQTIVHKDGEVYDMANNPANEAGVVSSRIDNRFSTRVARKLHERRSSITAVAAYAAVVGSIILSGHLVDKNTDGLNNGAPLSASEICPVYSTPESVTLNGRQVEDLLGHDGKKAQTTVINGLHFQLNPDVALANEGIMAGESWWINADVPGDLSKAEGYVSAIKSLVAQTFEADMTGASLTSSDQGNTEKIVIRAPQMLLGSQPCPPGTRFA